MINAKWQKQVVGIEPTYAVLQTAALNHLAILAENFKFQIPDFYNPQSEIPNPKSK